MLSDAMGGWIVYATIVSKIYLDGYFLFLMHNILQ